MFTNIIYFSLVSVNHVSVFPIYSHSHFYMFVVLCGNISIKTNLFSFCLIILDH